MRLIKHLWRLIVLWFVLGMCYVTLELLFRGVTYVQMIWVGGLCGLLIGLISRHPQYYDRKMWQKCLIGAIITLIIEFCSGCILNLWLRLNIWDYSDKPYNLYGQICAQMALAWFFLMPFAIYLDDWIRWKLFNEQHPRGGPFYNYILLFTDK